MLDQRHRSSVSSDVHPIDLISLVSYASSRDRHPDDSLSFDVAIFEAAVSVDTDYRSSDVARGIARYILVPQRDLTTVRELDLGEFHRRAHFRLLSHVDGVLPLLRLPEEMYCV